MTTITEEATEAVGYMRPEDVPEPGKKTAFWCTFRPDAYYRIPVYAHPLVAPQAEGRDTGLREAAQKVYDKLASETGTVTILDQEALGDALRTLSPKEPE